ncbi:MAG TPA: ABC transporter substrate-binding protein [Acidimicrobiia bacterium]|nr:ABC transporter substrate-binding protein [Acidimicrobiia bacterium]
MKRFSVAVCAVALVISTGLVAVGTVSAGAQNAANKATEVGVTADTIRIAVVADVDNVPAPGLFQGAVDAVEGAAKYINAKGGIAGRKVQVDFIDSHLNPNEARNAVITACQQDFALVGTAALFLSNMDDAISCKDINGQATGLPDLPGIVTGIPETCAPITFSPTGPQLLCDTKDQHPQTYQGNQGDTTYYKKHLNKKISGAFVLPNDTPDANRGDAVQEAIAVQNGVKADQSPTASGRDPQSVYTPVVQKMKADGSNWGWSGLAYANVVQLRQEAQLQGLNDPKIIWGCTTACYTQKFIDTGGDAVNGEYIPMAFLPFNETKYNQGLADYIKYTGKDKAAGLGVYSWAAGIELQQALQSVVKAKGNNAITRANLLDALKNMTSFDSNGFIGKANVGGKVTTSCFILEQVKDGKFVRVWPTKPGTFDCTKSNHVTVKADLIK